MTPLSAPSSALLPPRARPLGENSVSKACFTSQMRPIHQQRRTNTSLERRPRAADGKCVCGARGRRESGPTGDLTQRLPRAHTEAGAPDASVGVKTEHDADYVPLDETFCICAYFNEFIILISRKF